MSSETEKPHGGETPFQAHLAMGLHAFAQPLSILRAKLYAENIARLDSGELTQLANDSAAHVERLCTLFNYLQEIVVAENAQPVLTVFRIDDVLEHIVDGLELWFQDTGLTLTLDIEEPGAEFFADKTKLSQAVSSLVLLAHGQSKAGETVTITFRKETGRAEIIIANSNADVAFLNADGQLALALVETILRRQGGSFVFTLRPLSLHACVPTAAITT